ncbi:MAG: carbohydrate ABC transporter permease [Candidatus Bipolaricaulaceae bacterium]
MVSRGWRAWIYVGPAVAVLLLFLVYPSIMTMVNSFRGPRAQDWVGLTNYIYAFTNPTMVTAFRNNALWVVFFTFLTVGLGLIIAVLVDRVRYERFAKSVIFLPMAISMVGASVIWKFMYAYKPAGVSQIGLLNAAVTAFGGQPQAWLISEPWNTFAIIVVGVWIWTGFCMVVLSAALKNIPNQLLEAARIDGASEWQIFWKITLRLLGPTVAVVTTTMVVFVLKIFDFVYVMTNGNFNTEVIANRMYKEMFLFGNFGRASALAMVLFILVAPMMVINIRRFRRQREIR